MARRFPGDGYADVLIGLQHGDEGKGRFVDGLADLYDIFVRYNGGANAGHTVVVHGKSLALHQIPSGVHQLNKKLFIASQCVVNLEKLCAEIDEVEKAGLPVLGRLRISSQASVIQPGHIIQDQITMGAVGTTGNGIGAAYAAQALRMNLDRRLDIRLGDLLHDTERSFEMIKQNLEADIQQYGIPGFDVEGTMNRLRQCFERVRGCIDTDPLYLIKEIRGGMRILLEGAQAFGLDKTSGVTPDVTSSNTGVQAAFLSAGIPVEFKRYAYGVAKLIPSRVGHGPFVSEFGGGRSERHCMEDAGKRHTRDVESQLFGNRIHELLQSDDPLEVGIALRMIGGEYGASTGRPRRIGMLDLMQLKFAIALNGIDGIFLTKADQLVHFSKTRPNLIPTVYSYSMNGERIASMPTTKSALQLATPNVRYYPSFPQDISLIRDPGDLPNELRNVLAEVEDSVEARILAVGVGPGRDQVVHLSSL
ncbi:adenylosuccinate synthetase [Candidatus Uhrbacteria bacterium]|nr:adenylosuccinate synthetase [Candidatus Uhrbacteria bacterium]